MEKQRNIIIEEHKNEYQTLTNTLQHLENEELRAKIEGYYLEEIIKLKKRCRDDRIASFTSNLCGQINEINNSELEYYLEYSLEFCSSVFELVIYGISSICRDVNFYLSQICDNYLRYSSKKDKEALMDTIFVKYQNRAQDNPELQEIYDATIDIEKQHILNCYDIAKAGNTFCELCGPFCSKTVKDNDTGKIIRKRTIPNR